jgi:hypothetical protein
VSKQWTFDTMGRVWAKTNNGSIRIATVNDGSHCSLIAASPELLDGCKAAVTLIRGSSFVDSNPTLVKLIKAINNAERESE